MRATGMIKMSLDLQEHRGKSKLTHKDHQELTEELAFQKGMEKHNLRRANISESGCTMYSPNVDTIP